MADQRHAYAAYRGSRAGKVRLARQIAVWIVALAAAGCANLRGWGAGCGGAGTASKVSAPAVPEANVEPATHRGVDRKKKLSRKENGRRAKRAALAVSSGTAWRALAFFVPDVLEGYRARAATEGRDVNLGQGLAIVSVKRAYARDNLQLELEVIDAAHSERVRDLFARARELQRETETAVIRPMKIQGQKALSQWLDATKIARTSVLVADRFLVNANVKPADSPAPSIALAQKLDWAALEKLAAQPASPLDALDDALAVQVDAGGASTAVSNTADEPVRASGAELPDSSMLASQPQ